MPPQWQKRHPALQGRTCPHPLNPWPHFLSVLVLVRATLSDHSLIGCLCKDAGETCPGARAWMEGPGETTQSSAIAFTAPVSLGSSPTAQPGLVRRVRKVPSVTGPARSFGSVSGSKSWDWRTAVRTVWTGGGHGASCHPASPPHLLSSVYSKASPNGHPGPPGVNAQPPVALPDASGTTSVPAPPAWRPSQLPLHPSAQDQRPRRSCASCLPVIVSAPAPWTNTCPGGVASWPRALPSPSICLLLLSFRRRGLGALGTLVQLQSELWRRPAQPDPSL